jgi:hypothetical protein
MSTSHSVRDAAANKGLLGVKFSADAPEDLDRQRVLDNEMAEIWRSTEAGQIRDVTKSMVGDKYEEFTGERFNLVQYFKQAADSDCSSQPLSGQNQFVILDNILTQQECSILDTLVKEKWQPLPNRYREADVYVLSSPQQSSAIAERLEPYVPDHIVDEFGLVWDLVGPNNGFFRLIRYVNDKRDRYPIHYDLPGNRLDSGVLPGCQDDETRGKNCQKARTFLTFNIYLNGKEKFDEGLFTVYESPSKPWFTLQPEAGRGFLFRQGQTKGYLHDAGAIDLSNHPDGFKSIIRIDFVYKLNEERSDPARVAAWERLRNEEDGERHTCPYCPEVFRCAEDLVLHEGIHDNPVSAEYECWKQKLDAAFDIANTLPPAPAGKRQVDRNSCIPCAMNADSICKTQCRGMKLPFPFSFQGVEDIGMASTTESDGIFTARTEESHGSSTTNAEESDGSFTADAEESDGSVGSD